MNLSSIMLPQRAAATFVALGLSLLAGSRGFAQNQARVQITLAEQGKPVPRALVVLQKIKNEECVKLFDSLDSSPAAAKKAKSCLTDLPDANTGVDGTYLYQQLAPGWYDIRFLWAMTEPPDPGLALACRLENWGFFYEPGRDRTGKYDAMVQGMPFELKEGETRPISFDYRNQFASAKCLRRPANAMQPGKSGRARISRPGKRGVLELDPGPTAWRTELRNQGAEIYLQAMNRRDHLLVTAFLTEVPFPATPDRCRKERWRNEENALRAHDISPGHARKSTQNGMALVEFTIDHSSEGKLEMKDIHAYLGSGNLCAEVHLSKVFYKPEERELFDEVLMTVRFFPDETADEPANAP